MPDKNWKPWCDIDYSSASHNPDVRQKAYYDSKPSKSIGGGCNMPELGYDDAMYLVDPANASPSLDEITVIEEVASGISREDRLGIVKEWTAVKERELAKRKDARFMTTCFVPIPNELSAKDAVKVGHEMCWSLFGGDHLYSFSLHGKESNVRRITDGRVVEYARLNNHIHIIFSERRLSDGKKGTGAARKFKGRDALRKMINNALADALIRRSYKIGSNAGTEKKVRVTRGEYQENQKQNEQEIAVAEAEKKVEEKRAKLAVLTQELASMEKELEAQGKVPGKYHASPEAVARIAENAAKVSTTMELAEKLKTQSQSRNNAREGQQPMSPGRDR